MNRLTTWAAIAALTACLLALTTPTQAAPAMGAAWKVTAAVNTTTAISKETVLKVRGKVSPRAAGEEVVLQQRVLPRKPWKATGSATVKDDGSYLVKDDPGTPGTREYRVVKSASQGRDKGISKSVSVEVYAWERLATRTADVVENIRVGSATIGTDRYPASLLSVVPGTLAKIEYTLDRKCTDFRTTTALDHTSASGSFADILVTADAGPSTGHEVFIGQSYQDELFLYDSLRISIYFETSTSPAAVAALGTPEVLCTR